MNFRLLRQKIADHPFLAGGFLLVILSALAYLPFASKMGLYYDDWYLVYSGLTRGTGVFHDIFASDRPFRAWFVGFMFQVFGANAPLYTYSALVLRILAGLGFFWLLRLAWPRSRGWQAFAAALFVIYPGFLNQPNALDYQSHLFSFTLAVFSLALTIKSLSVSDPVRRWGLVALSALSQIISLLLMEYYIGLEGLRLALIGWGLAAAAQNGGFPRDWKRLTRAALLNFIPPLLATIIFMLWRSLLFENTRSATDLGGMLGGLLASPGYTLSWMFARLVQDVLNVAAFAWAVPAYALAFTLRLKDFLAAVFVALIGMAAAWAGIRWLHFYDRDENLEKREARSLILIGLLGILATLVPVHFGSRHVDFANYSRFSLPASLGAVMLLAGLLSLARDRFLRTLFPLLLVGLALLTHTANSLVYVNNWATVKEFWWQVSWRAPQIEPGTVLIADYADQSILEDYFAWGPANLIYYPEPAPQPVITPLNAATLNPEDITAVLAGDTRTRERRSIVSDLDFANTLVLSMPADGACVHALDGSRPELSSADQAEIKLIAPFSRLDKILPAAPSHQPPAGIFGAEPAHGWCYYYQQAALARQRGDWQEIARLFDRAEKLDLRPVDRVEWLPFLEAFASLGDGAKVRYLAAIIREEPYLRQQACRNAQNLDEAAKKLFAEQVCSR
ncbi:MAG: hypothetical protein EHM81_04795 [Chloroflexi bacterium]|nr:MAG: hypothetical protein EHM81_04795 [Chloroflexota bacterium]